MDMVSFTIENLPYDLFIKLLVAGILGAIIGAERDLSGRPAGVRTNLIIALSSCLFTILSIEAFFSGDADISRVASQIVVGVGFLGGGALVHHKDHVLGLTTAADIWLVAAVGMAVGAGYYSLGVFAAVVSVIALVVLGPLSHKLERMGAKRAEARGMKPMRQSK